MPELPNSLEEAIAQAAQATNAAIADGYSRLQVELIFPELKLMPLAEQFLAEFTQFGSQLKVFFPDAGAAALARRDWGEVPFTIADVGSGRVPPEVQIQPEDKAFLFIDPSAVEVNQVEKLCEIAAERPVVMLNPRLEDAATIGIGYAGRQLRSRFLNHIESCYHLRPLEEDVAVFRYYPSNWQVWREINAEYQLIAEFPKKPFADELDRLIYGGRTAIESIDAPAPKKPGIFARMQRFLRTFR
jgi:hypothetical protein